MSPQAHTGGYPFTRYQECQWQPEQLAHHLAGLASADPSATTAAPSEDSSSALHHQAIGTQLLSRGWSSQVISTLRSRYGANRMPGDHETDDDDDDDDERNKRSLLRSCWKSCSCWGPIFSALISQLKEPMILMLLGSAGISVLLGNTADALSIAVALLIVALVAAIQEYRSEAALEKLKDLVPPTCTVLRDGQVKDHFMAKELVVGDLVLLATGDKIAADCRVVDSVSLTVDESALTGENHGVSKTGEGIELKEPAAGSLAPPLTQQRNIVFAGTLVSAGRGRALVVAVGSHTEFGKLATELGTVEGRKSPLQVKMDELSQRLATLSTVAISIIAIVGWCMGRPFLETLTVAVSLAVAAIPEGLPICVTVTLALGVLRMAQRNAIIKKLPVVESLGCATVVASDKTGTLTANQMTCRTVYSLAFPQTFSFSGIGYDPLNGCLLDSNTGKLVRKDSDEMAVISALFNTACLCNNATLVQSTDSSVVEGHTGGTLSGQPTELALLVGAAKANVPDPRPQYHRVQEIPFSSERKRMEVRARPVSGVHTCQAFQYAALSAASTRVSIDGTLFFVKGMPEKVLEECTSFGLPDGSAKPLTVRDRTKAISQSCQMASLGLRVLALAYGKTLGELVFAGLVGMEDPPREGVAESVQQLRLSGVHVMMVTGDSRETALAVAQRCGILGDWGPDGLEDLLLTAASERSNSDLESGGEAMGGDEIDSIPVEDFGNKIAGIKVFYRVVPRHKLAIVRALQRRGEVVLMTGDGVNDSLSLRGADIGIAMGVMGTDVAKEAADVVLADDDFQTITMAIAEGKGIFNNIRCFLAFQLSTSFAALAMASVATVFGLPNPLNAMQILWINIIMDGPPAQSLGVEPVDERILRAKPRKADDAIVTQALLLRAITSACLIVFLTLKVFSNELEDKHVTRRDTTMTFMTFVNCDLLNAYVCRSSERCFYELSLFSNPVFLWAVGGSIVGQLMVIYWPPLQEVFQTEALSPHDLVYIILLSSNVLWLDTLRKKFFPGLFIDNYQQISKRVRFESGQSARSWLPRWAGKGRAKSSAKSKA